LAVVATAPPRASNLTDRLPLLGVSTSSRTRSTFLVLWGVWHATQPTAQLPSSALVDCDEWVGRLWQSMQTWEPLVRLRSRPSPAARVPELLTRKPNWTRATFPALSVTLTVK
jgi:hypothetical protein